MANLQKFLTGFEWGEISDRLLARVDLAAYNKATKTMENAYPFVHGGATKRRGTLFVGEVNTSAQGARILPFVYSQTTQFVLVLNGGKMEFIKNGAFVETSPGVRYQLSIPYTESELPDIRFSQSGNTLYICHQNHFPKLLQRVTDTNWTLTDIPFDYYAVSDITFSNAYITFRIINGDQVFQVGDKFTITTTAGAISTISGPTNGITQVANCVVATTGSNILLTGAQDVDDRTLVTGDRILVKDQTLTYENGIYIVNTAGAWTRASDANSPSELNNSMVKVLNGTINSDTWFKQTATVATVGVSAVAYAEMSPPGNGQIAAVASMPGSNTTETWTIECVLSSSTRQEWSVTGSVSGAAVSYWKSGNYPIAVSFFEQRLYFAGTPQFPQYVWGSAAGDYLNLTVGNQDKDGVTVQIAGNDYNAITHLVSARNLLPLTSSTEFSLAGPNNFAISGTSSNVVKDHTFHGSNRVRPLKVGREVLFVQRDGRKVRAISYSVTEDANIAPDITVFAEHITRDGTIIDGAFAQNPDFITWYVRSDGTLLSLTLARDYDTTAWARHTTDGLFENVCVIPGSSNADDVYLVVKRTINGSTKRYVEKFDYDTSDVAFMDSAAYYDGAATTTLSGLSHLEGASVTIAITNDDGEYLVHPNKTVSSGSITLDFAVTRALVGLPFTTTVELLNPEFGDSASSSQGRTIGISDIIARFKDTVNCKINGTPVPFRTNTLGLDSFLPLFTGDKAVKSIGWRSPQNIVFTSDTPTPLTLLGVIIKAAVND